MKTKFQWWSLGATLWIIVGVLGTLYYIGDTVAMIGTALGGIILPIAFLVGIEKTKSVKMRMVLGGLAWVFFLSSSQQLTRQINKQQQEMQSMTTQHMSDIAKEVTDEVTDGKPAPSSNALDDAMRAYFISIETARSDYAKDTAALSLENVYSSESFADETAMWKVWDNVERSSTANQLFVDTLATVPIKVLREHLTQTSLSQKEQ
jgi:hypothetical protein